MIYQLVPAYPPASWLVSWLLFACCLSAASAQRLCSSGGPRGSSLLAGNAVPSAPVRVREERAVRLRGCEECVRARGLLCVVGLLLLGISASMQIIMKSKPIDNVLGLHAVHKLSGDVKATFDTIVS